MRAHKFQEKYTGCQMVIWHCESEEQARRKFICVVINPDNWTFIEIINI